MDEFVKEFEKSCWVETLKTLPCIISLSCHFVIPRVLSEIEMYIIGYLMCGLS